uniref:Acetoacetyl-CoA synthetase n=1 Tax=Phallusia mammillata TaxID=59560 RepID=A0A6F9D5X8_9ASCI|nr:acetoacetyl-CoA synthetase-like [Phallusia mammillata]
MPSNDIACSEDGLPKIMWRSTKQETQMQNFMQTINKKFGLNLESYRDLWKWSTENYSNFWEETWNYMKIIHSHPYSKVVDENAGICDIPEWFQDAKLNYAENMLRYNDDKTAIYATGEGQKLKTLTFKELRCRVALYASALKKHGIKCGDRVVGYIPNCKEAVEAMLAVASIGAIWSSTSPDFGVTGVLERFQQIQPKLIFSVEAVRYNNKVHSHINKLEKVVQGLPELQTVVVIPFVAQTDTDLDIQTVPKSMTLAKFLSCGSPEDPLKFEQLPFNHPLFVMYSSGTTGPPKCMVHSAGGTLLQHMKEHILHGNMTRKDCLLYYTTTGWMMWNWMVGALPSGGSIVVYDGSPFHPKTTVIFDTIDEIGVTILGTSAKCLGVMEEKGLKPSESHDLASLHTILSTGSPLAPHQYDYVREHVKKDLLLGSITGGTDIISCFMGQNPMIPVYRGELQSANLGMAVACYGETEDGLGEQVFDQAGELVCLEPFPCMPTHFWNDPDGKLYKKAYFSKFPGIWSHGDFCLENSRTHGFVMLGRSDATLNPNGVRFGTSELYTIIDSQFQNEIADSVAAAQRHNPRKSCEENRIYDQERVVLFLKMAPDVVLDETLKSRICLSIRTQLSPRHVPAVIMATEDIPYTISGKKVEVAITRILSGIDIKERGAFRNPQALDLYKNIPSLSDF